MLVVTSPVCEGPGVDREEVAVGTVPETPVVREVDPACHVRSSIRVLHGEAQVATSRRPRTDHGGRVTIIPPTEAGVRLVKAGRIEGDGLGAGFNTPEIHVASLCPVCPQLNLKPRRWNLKRSNIKRRLENWISAAVKALEVATVALFNWAVAGT